MGDEERKIDEYEKGKPFNVEERREEKGQNVTCASIQISL